MKAELLALHALFAILCVSTALMGEDPLVYAFFKHAHSVSGAEKHAAIRLKPEHAVLCAKVPDCDRQLMALLDARYAEVQRQRHSLERLYGVLKRLQTNT